MAGLSEATFVDLLLPESLDQFTRPEQRQIENFKDSLFTAFCMYALEKFQGGASHDQISVEIPKIEVVPGDQNVDKIPLPKLSPHGSYLTQELIDRIEDVIKTKYYLQNNPDLNEIIGTGGGGVPCRGGG